MAARAIWKGVLKIGRQEVGVKMYSALQARPVDFRLLHRTDLEPVQQRTVRKSDGKEVAAADRYKAYRLDAERAVILREEELDRLEPPRSRAIATCRFVGAAAIGPHWYDQPYHLGPDGDERGYFALAAALARREVVGIIRWTMRTKRHLGALLVDQDRLMVISLRRADQLVEIPQAAMPALNSAEVKLAEQLVELAASDFDPEHWKNEYRERLLALVEAKSRGKRKKLTAAPVKRPKGTLGAQLRLSLARAKESGHA